MRGLGIIRGPPGGIPPGLAGISIISWGGSSTFVNFQSKSKFSSILMLFCAKPLTARVASKAETKNLSFISSR